MALSSLSLGFIIGGAIAFVGIIIGFALWKALIDNKKGKSTPSDKRKRTNGVASRNNNAERGRNQYVHNPTTGASDLEMTERAQEGNSDPPHNIAMAGFETFNFQDDSSSPYDKLQRPNDAERTSTEVARSSHPYNAMGSFRPQDDYNTPDDNGSAGDANAALPTSGTSKPYNMLHENAPNSQSAAYDKLKSSITVGTASQADSSTFDTHMHSEYNLGSLTEDVTISNTAPPATEYSKAKIIQGNGQLNDNFHGNVPNLSDSRLSGGANADYFELEKLEVASNEAETKIEASPYFELENTKESEKSKQKDHTVRISIIEGSSATVEGSAGDDLYFQLEKEED